MRVARIGAAAVLLAGSLWLLAAPEIALAVAPRGWSRVGAASLAILAAIALLAWLWPATDDRESRSRWPAVAFALALILTLAGCAAIFSRWVDHLVLFAIDPTKGDMLVEITLALDRLSTGQDPYFVYHVPWDLPLTYGPWLWGWFAIPRVLGADPRMMTAFGQLFVPMLTGLAAAFAARDGAYGRSVILLALGAVLVSTRLLDDFIVVGHTPAYWPLMATFAMLWAAGALTSASVLLGLLVAARTPMVALVPVFAIHLWHMNRPQIVRCGSLVAGVVALSFLPFALWDWRTLLYGMYGYYVTSIRHYVWTQTDWMSTTLGLTRVLLAAGHSSWIVASQVGALLLVYALAWRSIKAGARPGPWCCLALLAFSMTTLWPVWYVFLDVFFLGASFLASDVTPIFRRVPWRILTATTGLVALVMTATLAWNPGIFYSLEPGRTPRWHFRSGFGPDEIDGARAFVRTTRQTVHMRLPRGFRTDAHIKIECQPITADSAPQVITATLNGAILGAVPLGPSWQVASFPAPRRDWQIGHNDLMLTFDHVEPGPDGESQSVRISKLTIAR